MSTTGKSERVFGASGLPAQPPTPSLETQPFWDAAAEGRLVLPRCDACGFVIWYPRRFCPECSGRTITWFAASGAGTIYSCTVTRKGQGAWSEVGPYVLAIVELTEGPRLMTNVVGADPASVRIGAAVEVVFDGGLPRFRLAT